MTLGIYVQVPFCQTKCTYCNFHTGVVSRDRYQPYANAICREIESEARSLSHVENSRSREGAVTASPSGLLGGRSFSSDINPPQSAGASAPEVEHLAVDSIYFGGGTPSLLEPSALAQI